MKVKINIKKGSYMTLIPNNLSLKSLLLLTLVCLSTQTGVQAQEVNYTKPSWYFGVAAATNYSFYRGSTHQLN